MQVSGQHGLTVRDTAHHWILTTNQSRERDRNGSKNGHLQMLRAENWSVIHSNQS